MIRKRVLFIIIGVLAITGISFSQGPIKRKNMKKEKTEQTQSSESKRQQEAEAKRQREAEARRQREAEAKRRQEEEVRRQREAEAKRQREAEAKRKQEEEENRRKKEQSTEISEPDGYIGRYGYVDLGLPSGLKWATYNVGASSPSEYGNYYAWGETSTKSYYSKTNSKYYTKNYSELRSDGIIDSRGNLTMSHDAANTNWGGTWRMPTKEDVQELMNNCTRTWIKKDGHYGMKITGCNGKSIFLPAGERYWPKLDSRIVTDDASGFYGISTNSTETEDACFVYTFLFGKSDKGSGKWYGPMEYLRSDGKTIRPVSK